MIAVIAYKNGKDVRHEQCFDVFSADMIAEEMMESGQYDEVKILSEEEYGPKKTI
jgi:hypothetical protein